MKFVLSFLPWSISFRAGHKSTQSTNLWNLETVQYRRPKGQTDSKKHLSSKRKCAKKSPSHTKILFIGNWNNLIYETFCHPFIMIVNTSHHHRHIVNHVSVIQLKRKWTFGKTKGNLGDFFCEKSRSICKPFKLKKPP